MRRLATSLLLCLLVLGSSALSNAQSAQTQVERGLSEFQDLEFSTAIETLEGVLRAPDARPSEKLLALELIAISHLSLGQTEKARNAFRRLLELSPDYELRNHDGSPKVESVFNSVRARLNKSEAKEPDGKLGDGPDSLGRETRTVLAWLEPKAARAGKRLVLRVQSAGPEPAEVLLTWRVEGETREHALPLEKRGATWGARLSLPAGPEGYQLLYYVSAIGPEGKTLAVIGDTLKPERLAVRGAKRGDAGRSRAWYSRWPVLVGIGVAAVAGTSAVLLSSGSDLRQGALSPGRITLSP